MLKCLALLNAFLKSQLCVAFPFRELGKVPKILMLKTCPYFFFYNTALAWLKCCAIPNETFFWCLCILCVVWQQHCKNDNYKNVKKEISRLNSDIKKKFPLRCKSFGNLLWLLEDRTILMFPCCKSHLHIKAKNIYKMGTCVMSFVACISLGSEHINESLPRRVYLQFESSLHGQRT